MWYGCDINKTRFTPSFSGQRATCPTCDGDLIGNCGEILTWHWKHAKGADCDPWKENETPWHREWKMKFPENYREITIESAGQKHRADIKTQSGWVIEFQNSTIPAQTIRERESFYGQNMVWVINAHDFKGNFKMRSVVQRELRKLGGNSNDYQWLKEENEKEIHARKEKLFDLEVAVSKIRLEIEKEEFQKEEYESIALDYYNLHKEILGLWDEGKPYWGERNGPIIRALAATHFENYKKITNLVKNLTVEVDKTKEALAELDRFEIFVFEGTEYKLVPKDRLFPTKDFALSKSLEISSMYTLLPKVSDFKDEEDYKRILHRKDQYKIIFDGVPIRLRLLSKVQNIKDTKHRNDEQLSDLRQQILLDIQKLSAEGVVKSQAEIDELYKCLWKAISQENSAKERLEEFIKSSSEEIDVYRSEDAAYFEKEKFEVMQRHKGQYEFYWNYERKSWATSKRAKYFDTGEDYLLKYEGGDSVKKVSKLDFIKQYTFAVTAERA